jgi:hypothetical protein
MLARYNRACSLARAGQPDSALAALQLAMDAGYGQTEALLADADLASLRGDPRFAPVVERCRRNQRPCDYRPESRQFDFWIGDWNVTSRRNPGQPAGTSHVELLLNNCVIFENWTGRLGGSGKSFNAWNADFACWQQNWMDDTGSVTNYTDGHFAGDSLTFFAERKPADAPTLRNRLTFVKLGPDQVRQRFDHTLDGGATWIVDIDLDYRRKK